MDRRKHFKIKFIYTLVHANIQQLFGILILIGAKELSKNFC